MFIICFGNGLGNQMFQYAFYLSMKKKYAESRVLMDIGHVEDILHNGFELDNIFGIERNECTRGQSILYSDCYPKDRWYSGIVNLLFKIKMGLFGEKSTYIVQDNQLAYYDEYYNLNPLYTYLFRGVWANAKYLEGIEEEIKRNFKFNVIDNELNNKYIKLITECNSVSVHVRRGDYLNYSGGKLNILTEDYYKKAVEYIRMNTINPKFFVFSDDIEYCRTIFGEEVVYVEGNKGKESYMDMYLMSICKHNIIANSTFSFWGAYLNSNQEKIVISPDKYAIGMDMSLSCEGWIKIEV